MPVPNYALADQSVSVDVAAVALPTLRYLAQSAGMNNVLPGGVADMNVQKYMLGFAVRVGLQSLNSVQLYAAPFVERYDARFAGTTSAVDALLFADDIALASSLSGICDCLVPKLYRTAAHYFFALYDSGLRAFFVPHF
jgi:hypothetical protein